MRIASPVLLACLIHALAAVAAGSTPATRPVSSVDTFIRQRSEAALQALMNDEKVPMDVRDAIGTIMDYDDASAQLWLPNSMARTRPRTRTEVRAIYRRLEQDYRDFMKLGVSRDLVEALALQTFRDGLDTAAAEIAFRMWPAEYDDLLKRAREISPEKAEMLSGAREAWIANLPNYRAMVEEPATKPTTRQPPQRTRGQRG